jgi:uncharacterized protein
MEPVPTVRESRLDHQRRRTAELGPVFPDRVPWRAVVTFLAIAIGLAWAVQSPLWISGLGLEHPLFMPLTFAMMYTPAIATFIVVLFVKRPSSIPRLLGLAPLRPRRRTILLCLSALVGMPVLAFASMLLGSALGLIDLDFVTFSGFAERLEAQGVQLANREVLIGFVAIQLLVIPINAVASSIAAFGEELGWRGWLLPNLLPLGTWPALGISGVVWGVWHAPIILLGYNYNRTDITGVLLMVGWCTLLGVVFGWLRLRSASVWPAVIAHGAINGSTAILIAVFLAAGAPAESVFGTVLGWPGAILLVLIIVTLWATGQLSPSKRAVPGLTIDEASTLPSEGRQG